MLINGKEKRIDLNRGNMGLLYYEQAFKRSLTVDLLSMYNDGQMLVDSLALLRFLYIMTGSNKHTTFEGFLIELGEDFDVLEYAPEIIEQAIYSYIPSARARVKE